MASSNSEDAETRQPRASDDSTNGEQSGEELQSISRTALIGSFVAMYLTNFLASLVSRTTRSEFCVIDGSIK